MVSDSSQFVFPFFFFFYFFFLGLFCKIEIFNSVCTKGRCVGSGADTVLLEDEEGVELFVLLLLLGPEDPSLCKEPGAVPAPLEAPEPCPCVRHSWSKPYLWVYPCVCT